jgi:hypothetical protein
MTLGSQPNHFTQDPVRIRGHQAIVSIGWTIGWMQVASSLALSLNSLHLDIVGTDADFCQVPTGQT